MRYILGGRVLTDVSEGGGYAPSDVEKIDENLTLYVEPFDEHSFGTKH